MSKPSAFRGVTIFSKLEAFFGGEGVIFGAAYGAEVVRSTVVGFAFRAEIPLEAGFDTGSDEDDTSVFPACHDTRSFLGGGKGTGASSMPKSATDEALTRLGARISALWKGCAGS